MRGLFANRKRMIVAKTLESGKRPLGVIVGEGKAAELLYQHLKEAGRPAHWIVLDSPGQMAPDWPDVPYHIRPITELGAILKEFNQVGVTELVFAGRMRRPVWHLLRPDMLGLQLLGRLITSLFRGDDAIIRMVHKFLEEQGFTIMSLTSIMPNLLISQGVQGKVTLTDRDQADMMLAAKAASVVGILDAGQAAVARHGVVLGLEGVDGTDALLRRCQALEHQGNVLVGAVVKMCKPIQDRRSDLPAVGETTVELAHAAGLKVIGLEAGAGILLDPEATLARADTLGVAIIGIASPTKVTVEVTWRKS
jgi:DUF1009 family protein